MGAVVSLEAVKMMQKSQFWCSVPSFSSIFLLASLAVGSCALPAAPNGGPRDQKPPDIEEASIRQGSVNVSALEASWKFDEYVVLSSPQQNFVSSPPLPSGTTYELRSKTFIVTWPEPLLENSTYVFQWGNTIRDLHEGNVLKGIQWVFSTGNALDSGEIQGQVVDPWTGKGIKDAAVCLYPAQDHWRGGDAISDSCVFQVANYATRTNDSGYYTFSFLRTDTAYAIRAFADADGNNKLSPGELTPIGFLTDTWRPWDSPWQTNWGPVDYVPPILLMDQKAKADSLLAWEPWGADSSGTLKLSWTHGCGPRQAVDGELSYPEGLPFILQLKGKTGIYSEWPSDRPCAEHTEVLTGLPPGSYTLQAVYDCNANGILDAGDYWSGQGPETRIFATEKIEIKANWEVETHWELPRNNPISWEFH
ncbi:MAG: Ig-like domain-containing protein [Schleiferiaceae bacterium]|nr:Ig-like domain-containing protein [Schleiferiaceae bacterium]